MIMTIMVPRTRRASCRQKFSPKWLKNPERFSNGRLLYASLIAFQISPSRALRLAWGGPLNERIEDVSHVSGIAEPS